MSGLVTQAELARRAGRAGGASAVDFAAGVVGLEPSPQGPWSRLGRLFAASEGGISRPLGDEVRSAELQDLSPHAVQSLAELFGLGDSQSLGYYDDLYPADRYAAIYRFLFEVRLALEETQLRLRG